MRQLLTLSLPAKTKKLVQKRAKKRGFDSVSKYLRFLIDEDNDNDVISSEQLLKDIEKAKKENKKGEYIEAKSVKDLL